MRFKNGYKQIYVGVILLLADRITKLMVQSWLSGKKAVIVIPGVLNFNYSQNTGVAFSLFSDRPQILALVTAALSIGVIIYIFTHSDLSSITRTGLWLLAAGGLGNVIDRVIYGYVIDFIDPVFINFAIFNIADIGICLGAIIAAIGLFISEKKGASSYGR